MIGELSDPVRKIYELTLQEFSNEEIAEQLGLTVDSVKAHKKRGKQILKERLKGLMAFCRAKFLQPHYTPKSTNLRLFRNIAMARLKCVFTVVSAISIWAAISLIFFFSTI